MKKTFLLIILSGVLGNLFSEVTAPNTYGFNYSRPEHHTEKTDSSHFRILDQNDPLISQTQLTISFTGILESGTMVAIDFECLEGANPAKFGYFVALWQGNQIMSLSDAKEIQSINNTTQDGSFVFENLSIDNLDYTIGFGVDLKDSSTICSTLLIPKGTKLYDTLTSVPTTLELIEQSTNSLIAKFKAPLFTTPNMDKNWIALFEGQFTSNIYSGINLVKLIRVPNNTNKGEVVMNDIPGGLIVDQHYTLVYGMGTNNSQNNKTESAVAATVFRVPPRRN